MITLCRNLSNCFHCHIMEIHATIILKTPAEKYFQPLREDSMTHETTHENDSLTLSQIFHEIKNPLTLINSSLQLIESDHPEVKTFRFWNQTMEDMKNLRLLLDDLSDFQKGDLLKITELSAFDFMDDLLDSIEAFLLENGTPLILEEPSEDFTFFADGTKLRRAVINLLKNAAESSWPGIQSPSVSVLKKKPFLSAFPITAAVSAKRHCQSFSNRSTRRNHTAQVSDCRL